MERHRPFEQLRGLLPPGGLLGSGAVALRRLATLEPDDHDAVPGRGTPPGRAPLADRARLQVSFPAGDALVQAVRVAGRAFEDLDEHVRPPVSEGFRANF